jgi:hypothetical protein
MSGMCCDKKFLFQHGWHESWLEMYFLAFRGVLACSGVCNVAHASCVLNASVAYLGRILAVSG